METKITEARKALEDAELRMNAAGDAIALAEEGVDTDPLEAELDSAIAEYETRKAALTRYEKVQEARKAAPALSMDVRVTKEEPTYRPDSPDQRSFLYDLVHHKTDPEAAKRLMRNDAEMRNVTSAAGQGGGFIPPQYLAEYAVEVARQGRPFANVLPSVPLPDTGMVITLPKMDTGASEAAQVEGSSVSETDVTSSQLSVYVRTIAGQQDVSLQLLERSNPAFDQIIFRDLALAHATELDRQLIRGAAASSESVGIRNVSGIVSVTYTDSTPTAAELLPKLYDAVQQVLSQRYLPPTHWVMHPRRAAFLASNLSSTFPLFQQGGFYRGVGEQDGGVPMTIAGYPVVVDANVGTTYGSSTSEDEIYLVRADDMPLMEGPVVTRVLDQVLSGTLEVRLQLFSYVAAATERYPKGIAKISGTGLVSPSF